MTAAAARVARTTPLIATQPDGSSASPSLRLVPAPAPHRSKVAFLMVCIAVLAAAMFSALLMNTAMAAGAYEKYDLTQELTRVEGQQQTVREQLIAVSTPQHLAQAAQALGMVASPGYAGIRLADGAILGAATPAGGQ